MQFAGLIYDIGMFDGIDTRYFLKNNYQVIAVEADPTLAKKAIAAFPSEVDSGQLTVLNFALADTDDQDLTFSISENAFWNSLKPGVAGRLETFKESITVKSRKLSTLFKQYGVPTYCKVDIEGYDAICVSTLQDSGLLPDYVSVETECIGENEVMDDKSVLQTLDTLHSLGYNQFKLVDQTTLATLELGIPFYGKFWDTWNRWKNRYFHYNLIKDRKKSLYYHFFYTGATGGFGASLGGKKWYNYNEARQLILEHRKQYFDRYQLKNKNFTFWCDWHAKK
jgi:FkbM family methyltransferase